MSQTLIEKHAGADYSLAGMGIYPPVTDGLVGWYYIGSDDRSTTKNHAVQGSMGMVSGTPTYASGGAENITLILPHGTQQFTGDVTAIAVFQPGDAGSDLSTAFTLGSLYKSAPTRYGIQITQRTFSGDAYDVLFICGTYDGTPGATGINNSSGGVRIDDIDPTQIVFAIGRFNATTRVSSIKLRNGSTLLTPRSSAAAAAPAGHVRDLRNTYGLEAYAAPSSGARAYFGAMFTKTISATEEDALYAFIAARLAERGVTGL